MFVILSSPPHLSTTHIMQFQCTSCPKIFASEVEQASHTLTCSKKTSCSVPVLAGNIKAYKNSQNRWLCHCDTSKCRKLYPTFKALEMHIRRDATITTKWKVCLYCLYKHLIIHYIIATEPIYRFHGTCRYSNSSIFVYIYIYIIL